MTRKYDITAEQFVEAWQKSTSVQGVADLLGMPKSTVRARAGFYRKRGVKLRRFRSPRRQIDVAKLNEITKAHRTG